MIIRKYIWEGQNLTPEALGKQEVDTSLSADEISYINEKINKIPDSVNIHSILDKVFTGRYESFKQGQEIDWASAEMLAFASLLKSGQKVRLTGEDSERGTFSQRNATVIDQQNFEKFNTLSPILDKNSQQNFEIYNSLLAEYAPLAFEYGYSIGTMDTLCLWEAQFGDFANVGQVIIDNLIASGERKWGLMSGLVMLLPHGMDGLGPEHSNARVERFLDLCDDEPTDPEFQTENNRDLWRLSNMVVANVTNPANYFHLLRTQMMNDFRKPIALMAPKKLLRYKWAKSSLDEFVEVKGFQTVYGEAFEKEVGGSGEIEKVMICSGKVYYDLLEKRREDKIKVKRKF